jgi:hypothetical protein
MPERPIILFGRPGEATKGKRNGGPAYISRPNHVRQTSRLAPKLAELQRVIDQNKLLIQHSATGVEPEKTLVFAVKGELKSFYTAVKNLNKDDSTVELIFDTSEYEVPVTDDFFVTDKNGIKKDKETFSAKVYCVLANNRALEEMLSLWNQYSRDPDMKFPNGKTGLRDVFDNLVDMHFWGPTERIEETGILEAWTEDLQLEPELSEVNCEVELFYRKSKELQDRRESEAISYIENIGGKILGRSLIDSIAYHAVLISIPRQVAEDLISHKDIDVVNVEQIMFFRPVGQSVVVKDESIIESTYSIETPSDIHEDPIVALFDGLPQENHPYLQNLLVIDDPDDYTSQYTISGRKHGTSMASFIAHGEIDKITYQTTHRIYVRPIMKSTVIGSSETIEEIPDDILLVDKIHEAVRRLFVPEAGNVAQNVRIINLSIGISTRIFYNSMSPLARLLDWLSYTYKVLFVVSAGNHTCSIGLGMKFDEYSRLPMSDRDIQAAKYLNDNARHMRLLSPAESMNALTVGATFEDNTSFTGDARQLLFCSDGMPSPYSSLGRGLNNSVKPDVIYRGGRNTLLQDRRDMSESTAIWRGSYTREPGTVSAAPFDLASDTAKIMYSCGTSNATALLSHEASRCHDVLVDVFNAANETIPYDNMALMIKAMLVHGAQWGELYEVFSTALGFTNRQHSPDYLHKFLGYGVPDIERSIECAKNRITLIGYGELKHGEAHIYDLPLPFNLNREKILRRLTATLTYFTPIVPTRQKYRVAQLWYTIEGGKKNLLDDRVEIDWNAAVRGTVQHEIFENDDIVVWGEDDSIQLKVNCRGDATEDFEGSVPYALMVSFEIKSGVEIDVYEKVISKIRPRVTV